MSAKPGRSRRSSALLQRLDRSLAKLTIGFLAILGAGWLAYWRFSASAFDLSARTEVVELATGCRTQPRWILPHAGVRADGSPDLTEFVGQIEVGPRARLRVERIGEGRLRIVVRRDEDLPEPCDARDVRSLAVLAHAGEAVEDGATVVDPDEQEVGESLLIDVEVEKGSTLTLPFVAWAEIGQSLKSATREQSPILVSGEVTFLRSPLFSLGGRLPHPAGDASLKPGDRFFVPGQRDPGFGFVRVDDVPALLVGYRASGRYAEIERFGTRGYALSPTVLESFAGDSSLQLVLAVVGAVGALAQALKTFLD